MGNVQQTIRGVSNFKIWSITIGEVMGDERGRVSPVLFRVLSDHEHEIVIDGKDWMQLDGNAYIRAEKREPDNCVTGYILIDQNKARLWSIAEAETGSNHHSRVCL